MKFFIFIIFFCFTISVSFGTEASDYISKQCSIFYKNKKVHITVKKEHTEDYNQTVGNEFIPKITFGYGDMKINGYKKQRISYICLLNRSLKPIWGYVMPR